MRKSFLVLAITIAATLITAGCSKGADETQPAQTTTDASPGESSTVQAGEIKSGDAPEDSGDEVPEEVPIKAAGTITEVGEDSITVDSSSGTYIGEMVLIIDPENTLILDGADGLPVELKDVRTGGFEAYLGPAMTMSLPPQTTPEMVIVNIGEGQNAPQYVVAEGKVDDGQGRQTLTGADQTKYTLAGSVDIRPFLTKNLVRLEDIGPGSRCLVWMNDEGDVDRIVLFGE